MAGGIPQYMDVTPRVTGLDNYLKDINKVSSAVDAANKRISQQSARFTPFRFDTKQITRNLASVTSQFTNMWRGFDARSNVLTSFGNQLTSMGRSIRYFAFDFERLGRTLSVGLTLPIVAAGAAVVKWGSDFEQSLRKVEILVDQSRETVTRWGDEILTTMAGLGQSPNELAEGLFFAASAFGSLADRAPVMEVLRSAAAGATIGLGEMDAVTRLLTASVNAYGSENLGAAEAMYVLIRTVTEGNFQADKLATSLGRVLGSATALKIPFRDLVTYIAGITRIGEDPSRIITSLNSALLKLLNPTSKAQKILTYYGYSVEDVKKALGEPGGLLDMLNEFRDVMSDQAFGQLFTNRAVRTALVATDALRAEMQQINDSMTDAEKKRLKEIERVTTLAAHGINEEWAAMRLAQLKADKFYGDQLRRLVIDSTDTVKGQVKILKDTIQSIGIGAFQSVVQAPLLDFLKNINQQLISLNQVVQQNPQTVKLIIKIAAGLAALGPGVIIVSRLVQSLTVFTNVAGIAFKAVGLLAGTVINVAVKGFGILGTVVLGAARWMAWLPVLIHKAVSGLVLFAGILAGKVVQAVSLFAASIALAAFQVQVYMFRIASLRLVHIVGFFGNLAAAAGSAATAIAGFVSFISPIVALGSIGTAALATLTLALTSFLVVGGKVRKAIEPTLGKIAGGFNTLKKDSATWGEGLMAEYSNGILRGAAYVVRALTSIANIIASWLRPGSPPKILPEIDMWGKGAMEAWLEGWGKADFGILQTIMSDVGSYLKSVIDFGEDDNEDGIVAQMILGSQKSFIDAINEVKRTGNIAKETLSRIFDSLGTTTPALRGYIEAQLRVAAATDKITAAQNKLNDITAKYDKILTPLQRRLDAINAQQSERERGMRESELEDLLEQEIPEEIRAAALLELEEIGIERQIADLEQEQANVIAPLEDQVATAQEELDAATKQLEYWEGLMGLQENQASLLQDVADMLEEAVDELKKLKDKLGESFGAGTPIDPGELTDLGDGFNLGGGGDVLGEFDKQLASLMEEVEEMKKAWGGVFDYWKERWNTFKILTLNGMIRDFNSFKEDTLVPIGEVLASAMDTASLLYDQLAQPPPEGELPAFDMSGIFGRDIGGIESPQSLMTQWLNDNLGSTPLEVAQNSTDFINNTFLPGLIDARDGMALFTTDAKKFFSSFARDGEILRGILASAFSNIKGNVEIMLTDFSNARTGIEESWGTFKTNFLSIATDIKNGILGVGTETGKVRSSFGIHMGLMGVYATRFETTFLAVKLAITTAIDELKTKFKEWWDQLKELYGYIVDTFNKGLEEIRGLFNDIAGEVEGVIGWFGELITSIETMIEDGINVAIEALGENGLLGVFTTLADYISTTFNDVFTSVVNTINNVISLISTALEKLRTLTGLRNLLPGGGGDSSGTTTGGSDDGPDPLESLGFQALAAESVLGYNTAPYPINSSPFRNMSAVSATGFASTLGHTAAADESVSVRVAPGGTAIMDGGVSVVFGDVHISNGMEMAEFETRVERVIVNSLTR